MLVDSYLSKSDETERIEILRSYRKRKKGVSLDFCEAVIQLPVSDNEKFEIIESVVPDQGITWELFLIDGILNWQQNISARLIKLWVENSYRVLSHLLDFKNIPNGLPQRVFYTIVDLVSPHIGKKFYMSYANSNAINDYSSALHGLLLLRGIQFNSCCENVHSIARTLVEECLGNKYANTKGLLEAILFHARFDPEFIRDAAKKNHLEPWNSVLNSISSYYGQIEDNIKQVVLILEDKDSTLPFNEIWPILPFRFKLDQKTIERAIEIKIKGDTRPVQPGEVFEIFSGCEQKTLAKALDSVIRRNRQNTNLFSFIDGLSGLLGFREKSQTSKTVSEYLHRHSDHKSTHHHLILNEFEPNSCDMLERATRSPTFEGAKILEEASDKNLNGCSAVYKNFSTDVYPKTQDFLWVVTKLYSPCLVLNVKKPDSHGDFWTLLSNGIENQNLDELNLLAQSSRKQPYLINLCFIRALGLYKNLDEAALRLMEFVRSNNELEVSEVLRSLAGIDTPRSLQEIVGSITRPNISEHNQLEACKLLQGRDMSGLQSEIKSALTDLTSKKVRPESWEEVKDLLQSLLEASSTQPISLNTKSGPPPRDLDRKISERIQRYPDLSSEVKRALRTSQFFYDQVMGPTATENIEISPIIDMIYKSLELQFRESFEQLTHTLIKDGTLQRKLDVIGYARPIPKQMDSFESYIASLNIIDSIPFFSKFKLRKMLRALCQFKPGRRFTLDGIKAFALFFLCFSRNECKFGLANLFPVGLENDDELFEFVKSLHLLQDFRNRAVHEGFRPEARNDIDGIWSTAGDIYDRVFEISKFIAEKPELKRTAG